MSKLMRKLGSDPSRIVQEGSASTTYENVFAVRDLLNGAKRTEILVVTSAMHMPRASAVVRA